MAPRLKEKYDNEIAAQLKEDLDLDNAMQVPRLLKIVVN
ncbi:MAG: 50S ribosomal protein L5, partial [Actinomycetota bacterium]|nr:50S ribosomal protein L5 [Actinomycetota bacterium]